MDITLRLPDQLADDYRSHGTDLSSAILTTLLRFRSIKPQDRAIVLAHEDRAKLEVLLGGGHLRNSTDLRDKVEKLAKLRVGDIEIPFSVSEWREIELRAAKRGLSVEEECRRVVKSMHDLFFNSMQVG